MGAAPILTSASRMSGGPSAMPINVATNTSAEIPAGALGLRSGPLLVAAWLCYYRGGVGLDTAGIAIGCDEILVGTMGKDGAPPKGGTFYSP